MEIILLRTDGYERYTESDHFHANISEGGPFRRFGNELVTLDEEKQLLP